MNRKLKSLVMTGVVISLIATLLTGCGNTGSTSNARNETSSTGSSSNSSNKAFKSDKPLEFTMMFNDMSNYPYQDDWLLWKEIKDRTNVTLKLISVPMSDYEQKKGILISTGDAPEIIPKTYPGLEEQFIPSGAILPVSDYANKMPSYTDKVNKWNMKEDLKTIMQKDGKYYILPGLHEKSATDYSYAIRTDILEKNNLKTPTTYDELYVTLKKLKELYPDITPWSDRWQFKAALNVSAPTFGVASGWSAGNGMLYYKDKDQYDFYPITDGYKDMLTYFNKLVKEGLLDPESFTQNDDQAKQKFFNGKSFVMSTNSQEIISYKTSMDGTLGVQKYKIERIIPPSGPKGAVISGSRLENGIMLSNKAAKDPNFEQMLKFIDWLWYSDEGQTLTKWGVENKTYKVVNGKKQLLEDITFNGLNPNGTKDLRKQFGFSGGVFSYGGSQELKYSMMRPDEVEFQSTIDKTKTMIPLSPPVLFSEEDREQSILLSKPLMDFVDQMTLKFVLGNASIDNDWDKFVQDCRIKGCDKLTRLTNKVYEETKRSMK